MAPRAHWKGYLKLSLVSCPVALYPAIAAEERISFRQVNRQTGNRLRQQLIDTITGEVVQSENKGRGYQVGQNQFVVVKDEELEAAREEAARSRPFSAPPALQNEVAAAPQERVVSRREDALRPSATTTEETHHKKVSVKASPQVQPLPLPEPIPVPPPIVNDRTIALDRFVRQSEIDQRYLDSPYYIVPRDEVGQEAFAVIREAMRDKEMVGMGRVVLARRERPFIVQAFGDGMLGFTLRYAHEVRSSTEYFVGIPKITLPDEMLEVAERIIEMKAGQFDPAFLEDRYRTLLVEKLREKQAELPLRSEAALPSRQNVIDLMAALKRSLTAERLSEARPVNKPKARSAAASAKPNPRKSSPSKSRR